MKPLFKIVFVALALCLSGMFFLSLNSSVFAASKNGIFFAVGHGHLQLVNDQDDEVVIGAQKFIDSLTQRAVTFLGDADLSAEKRRKKFRKLLQDGFDLKTIGRFSLGRYWRTASAAQKKQYQGLFEDMIINVYSSRFEEYNGQEIEVLNARKEGKSDVIVHSKIIPNSGPKIDVDWRVRYKNGQYKIVDVIVEGVSMALTQRSDFAAVIQRGGGKVDVLIAHLQQ